MSKTQIKVPVIESPEPGPYDFEFENPVRQDPTPINEPLPYSKFEEEFKIIQEKNYNVLLGSAKVSHHWLYCGENDLNYCEEKINFKTALDSGKNDFFTVTISDWNNVLSQKGLFTLVIEVEFEFENAITKRDVIINFNNEQKKPV